MEKVTHFPDILLTFYYYIFIAFYKSIKEYFPTTYEDK